MSSRRVEFVPVATSVAPKDLAGLLASVMEESGDSIRDVSRAASVSSDTVLRWRDGTAFAMLARYFDYLALRGYQLNIRRVREYRTPIAKRPVP